MYVRKIYAVILLNRIFENDFCYDKKQFYERKTHFSDRPRIVL